MLFMTITLGIEMANANKKFERIIGENGQYNEKIKEKILNKINSVKTKKDKETIFWAVTELGDMLSIDLDSNGKEYVAFKGTDKKLNIEEVDLLGMFPEIKLRDYLDEWVRQL